MRFFGTGEQLGQGLALQPVISQEILEFSEFACKACGKTFRPRGDGRPLPRFLHYRPLTGENLGTYCTDCERDKNMANSTHREDREELQKKARRRQPNTL